MAAVCHTSTWFPYREEREGDRKGRNKEGRGEMSMGFSFICWTHI